MYWWHNANRVSILNHQTDYLSEIPEHLVSYQLSITQYHKALRNYAYILLTYSLTVEKKQDKEQKPCTYSLHWTVFKTHLFVNANYS